VGKFSSISSSHPPLFLNKNTYEKVKALADKNEIDVEIFIIELLVTALNHHGKEIQQIIEKVKKWET
jgi:hypothetical protein